MSTDRRSEVARARVRLPAYALSNVGKVYVAIGRIGALLTPSVPALYVLLASELHLPPLSYATAPLATLAASVAVVVLLNVLLILAGERATLAASELAELGDGRVVVRNAVAATALGSVGVVLCGCGMLIPWFVGPWVIATVRHPDVRAAMRVDPSSPRPAPPS